MVSLVPAEQFADIWESGHRGRSYTWQLAAGSGFSDSLGRRTVLFLSRPKSFTVVPSVSRGQRPDSSLLIVNTKIQGKRREGSIPTTERGSGRILN